MRSKQRRWVGIDGEGVGRDPHRYVMLACADGDYVERRSGLHTDECLDFITGIGTRDVRLCGYYLSYDWTMILRDLPDADLYMLLRPETRARPKERGGGFEWIKWEEYRMHFLAGAMWIAKGKNRSVVVWDLGKYYQGPFVNALEDWNLAPEVRDHIRAMKTQRATFQWNQRKTIREYCLAECRALSDLATCLEKAHIDAGIKPRGWHGPGSTAGALLAKWGIAEKRGIQPPEVHDAAARAFFGGRAEISFSGRVNRPVFAYDITSAYPYHAATLPCLEHGRWIKVRSEKKITDAAHALVWGSIERTQEDWGPLPVRLKSGSIVYPRGGASGVWWREEWLAARAFPGSRLRFEKAYILRSECECVPFRFLTDMFAERLRVGKNTGAGRVMKLGLNSCYGKLAQSVGSAQYASRIWAGMITSGTRAQVLDLMAMHKRLDSVLMVATDGVFSTEERDVGPVQLGGWERTDHPEGITLVRPGIYWTGSGKLRARGLGRENLSDAARERLSLALDRGEKRVALAPRTVFGGARLHVRAKTDGSLVRSGLYGQWHPMPTHVSLEPAPKRAPDWTPPLLDGVESAPYGTRATAKTGRFFEILELFRDLTL